MKTYERTYVLHLVGLIAINLDTVYKQDSVVLTDEVLEEIAEGANAICVDSSSFTTIVQRKPGFEPEFKFELATNGLRGYYNGLPVIVYPAHSRIPFIGRFCADALLQYRLDKIQKVI